ncbi:hypothetical protein Fot_35825 [Forsythia ovata]|uniref:Uncharacterized protein n=1 Tax=Forsythia ovata TaxID=205694 RepID=A0ABD1SMN7_9LAMI
MANGSPSMAKYTFSKISIFSIDEEEDDDRNMTHSLQSPILDTVPILVVTTSLVPESAMGASSLFLSKELLLSSESVRCQDKRKGFAEEDSEARGQRRSAGDEGVMRNTMRPGKMER